jgi:two-component system chemotaxis sensor kinase CheA
MARDPYKYFRIEARELLDQLGKGVLDLEKGTAAAELVARLLRLAHTLKGAARVVKLPEIADRAHTLEDVLAPFRAGGVPVPSGQVDALLRLLDEIGARWASLAPAPEPALAPAASIAQQESAPILGTDVEEVDALLDGLSEAGVQLASIRRAFAGLVRVQRLSTQLEARVDAGAAPAERFRAQPAPHGRRAAQYRGVLGARLYARGRADGSRAASGA